MGNVFLNLMDQDEVKEIIESLKIRRRIEKIDLSDVYKRILAEDIYAIIDLPPFDRAAMDGYAVRAQDTFGASEDNPITLDLIEKVGAGDVPLKTLGKRKCTEIGTGAPIPKGADSVIMVEFTNTEDGSVQIYEAVAPGTNLSARGSDMKKGELLLSKGNLLTPERIGALSAIGMSKVPVFTKPTVAVISTGNELIKPGQELRHGKLYDINSETISNAVKACGCTPIYSQIVKDDYDTIKNKINEFNHADVIITSGGTSAGAGDVLRQVVDDMGRVLVHGISVKPGKPTLIGTLPEGDKDIVLFGLPGYPVSALMIFNAFVAPFLREVAGFPGYNQKKESIVLKLSRRYHSARGRSHYVLAKIKGNVAIPIIKDSGAITALAEADGYFKVPKNVEIIEKGEEIKLIPFPSF
ncbi:MAG TPA: molybdopterin-binding protein [Methanobacterium sp.]|jgi:molybdopterin molybdotransferase|nr:molybdopterin molybdenumtransferase MoeA [Methanobacterium sp.]HOI39184.1 molybdopterin-binding protein [Methanobacterium sp.]